MPSTRKLRKLPSSLLCLLILLAAPLVCVYTNHKLLRFGPGLLLNCSQLCPYTSILTKDTLQFDPSHIIRHFPDFVCPQNFRNLADWVYGWSDQFEEHLEVTTTQGTHIAPCLPPGSIIYVRIWVINEFFYYVYPYIQNDFVLITGEGDLSSPTHMTLLEASDSKIIHWFGQNGQYDVLRSRKFTHIPIGNVVTLDSSCFPFPRTTCSVIGYLSVLVKQSSVIYTPFILYIVY